MGLPCLGIAIPLPQEAAGREDFNHIPRSSTCHSGIGLYSFWVQIDGGDEQAGGGNGTVAVTLVLLWHKRRGATSNSGVQCSPRDQSLVVDA